MRKLLLMTGALAAAASLGCGNKTPSGPGSVTVTATTTSTTTTIIPTTTTTSSTTTTTSIPPPAASARRYVAFQAPPNVPSDMSLFIQLIMGQAPASSSFFGRLRLFPMADPVYSVAGVFTTGSGIAGTVKGTLRGGPNPLDAGKFDGSLIAELPGCTAERNFDGSLTSQVLQWNRGSAVRDCINPQSWPETFTLLRSDAPLPTTTIVTTTTTIPPS